jgi:uncharacterized protein
MKAKRKLSRRKFVSSAVSASAISVLPGTHGFLRETAADIDAQGDPPRRIPLTATPPWRDQGILNLVKSPHAKLRSIPVHAVTIEKGFWSPRRATNLNASIPSMGKLLEVNGRMDNFRRLIGKSEAAQRGPVYSDSDIYKWIEAAGFALQSGERPELRAEVDKDIREIVAAQQPDGYLNTYYVRERAAQRMEPKVQQHGHELYCIGHLLQGGIAYYRATGDRTLLDGGIRFVNEFLLPNFGPRTEQKPLFSGHPEMELALVELYRLTGDKRHLEMARYLLAGDSRMPFKPENYVYHFCGIPFISRTHLEGHAVRAMYACCGATDYYLETGDAAYWKTLNTLWSDLVSAQMYVTGGVGARSDGEAFGDDYELPNATAYGESCAAIGNLMWNWRMLAATGEAKYADVVERALYNGINSGMSLNGTLYCYRNPLAFDPSGGDKIRNEWYDTTCCPPNLERTLASLPGYFYSTSGEGVYAHLYDNSTLDWHLENGTGLKIRQKTNYPWGGSVEIALNPAQPTDFTFFVRIPGWTHAAKVSVNGTEVEGATEGEYLPLRRRWSASDVVRLEFNMAPQMLEANARVTENNGRVAVQRGPLIYCMEQIDQGEGVALRDVALTAEKNASSGFEEKFESDLLGGVLVLRHPGAVYQESADRRNLYFSHSAPPRKSRTVQLMFIPYYAWANRVQTPMQVWTPLARA